MKMNKMNCAIVVVSLTLIAAVSSQPVRAQDSGNEATSSDLLDEVVVSARRREESLLDVPVAVSVATKAELERNQVYDLDDLQRLTPALEVSQTAGGEANGGARLRGLGTGVFTTSVASSVALVIDDVPIGNLSFPLLFDLRQVEILRGPQGTLFGQGASLGVVKVTTVDPTTDAFSVDTRFEFADKDTAGAEFGNMMISGGVNMPLGNNAALRIAAQYQEQTGLQRNMWTGKNNEVTDVGVRAKLLLTPSDRTTIRLIGEYAERTDDAWTFQAYLEAPPSPAANMLTACGVTPSARLEEYCSEFPGYQEKSPWALSANIEYEISDSLSLTSITSYRARDFSTKSVDYTRLVGANSANRENVKDEGDQISQELRFAYSGDGFDVIFGGFYQHYEFETAPLINGPFNQTSPGDRIGFSVCPYEGDFEIPGGPIAGFYGCAPFVYGIGNPTVRFEYEKTENRIYAAFADATITLSDRSELFGGLRYNNYENTTGVAFDATSPDIEGTDDDTDVSGRIGFSFKPGDTSSIFVSVATGYKPPAVALVPGDLEPIFLEPEKSKAFELGGRVQAGSFLLSGNVFYTDVENFQDNTTTNVGGQLIATATNIPSIESYGFEFLANGAVGDSFLLNAGYQYNVAEYPDGFLGDDGIDIGGEQLRLAPKHKVTLSGEYSFPFGNAVEGYANANVVYKSEMRNSNLGDPRVVEPSSAFVNVGGGVRDAEGKWSVGLFARNLTQEREALNCLPSVFAGAPDGGLRCWPGANKTARVVGISGNFAF